MGKGVKSHQPREYGAHEIREIAAMAVCDPRTVVRYLNDESIQGTSHVRISRAIETIRRAAEGERPTRKARHV